MAFISDYAFQNMTRIGNDSCFLNQKDIQYMKGGDYMVTNYFPDCPMNKAIEFATSQPNVFYSGGHQLGVNGCNVDYNSRLLISDLTRHKCKISLLQRPFATVPYLGRGPSNSILESHIQQGDMVSNRKSVNTTSEMSYMNYSNYPLIPSIEATISNPVNLIEDVAADGWIRGGLPSRNLTKDQDYAKFHTPHQY